MTIFIISLVALGFGIVVLRATRKPKLREVIGSQKPVAADQPEPISDLVQELIASIERGEWSLPKVEPWPEYEWLLDRPRESRFLLRHKTHLEAKLYFGALTFSNGVSIPNVLHGHEWMTPVEVGHTLDAIGKWWLSCRDRARAESSEQERAAIERAVKREAA